jgi:glucose-6-phosphate isomerase
MNTPISSSPAWQALVKHADALKSVHLRELFAGAQDRYEKLHIESDPWLLDISRQRITPETIALLIRLAHASGLPKKIEALFRGDKINVTEGRSVLHMALRSIFAGDAAIQAEVQDSRAKLSQFATKVRSGTLRGSTGRAFRHVVNVGIGGSDLGPLLVCQALRQEWSGGITPHFVSNVDRTQLNDLMQSIDPAETLVIICSKTFTTQETRANANAARAWIAGALGEDSTKDHFVAVSTNHEAMDSFGIGSDRRFTMWDWVGGRYSVWSAVGLIAELTLGSQRFGEFLAGASAIDRHFIDTPFERNLPALMGLLSVWNRSFLSLPTLAVLPYDQRLDRLPAYLQQLVMESNGKSVTLEGGKVNYPTAPVVWGEPGSNAQHSFFQMLHQGTATAALDFLAPLRGSAGDTVGQDLALQNCFGQAQAFAFGYEREAVDADMRAAGASPDEIARIAPHRVHQGNRPVTLLMYPRTTAHALGGLLALYEHSVFVQGVIWDINSFDQFGVELGKKLASGISLSGDRPPAGVGAGGLAALIGYVQKKRGRE